MSFNKLNYLKMKKKLLFSAIVIIASGTFLSCNQNDGLDTNPDKRMEVCFSSNILTLNSPYTRAVDNLWGANDAIGIYMFEKDELNVVESKSNVKYITLNGGTKGDFEETGNIIFFPDDGRGVRFMSYYPHDVALTDNVYKVDVSNQTNQPAIDLLYSFNDAKLYSKLDMEKKVSLLFNHQLTKICVNVKPGDGLDEADLGALKVSFTGLNTNADFNLFSGLLSELTGSDPISALGVASVEGYTKSYEAIVIPTVAIGNAKIRFDLDNGDAGKESDVFAWRFVNALLEGTKYTFNVTVNRSGIVVEAEITNWINIDAEEVDAE